MGSCKRVLDDAEIAQSVWDETIAQTSEDRQMGAGTLSVPEQISEQQLAPVGCQPGGSGLDRAAR